MPRPEFPVAYFVTVATLNISSLPSIWNESYILQKGSKSDACNYRGISKLWAISKHYENVFFYLQNFWRSVISPYQYGFLKRRSTSTSLLELTTFIIKGFRKIFKLKSFILISVKRLTQWIIHFCWVGLWVICLIEHREFS